MNDQENFHVFVCTRLTHIYTHTHTHTFFFSLSRSDEDKIRTRRLETTTRTQARCRGKTIKIFCGKHPTQNIRWLGNVAVARLSPNLDGWKTNGFATEISIDCDTLSFDDEIRKVLKSGEYVTVLTSMDGPES